METMGKKSFLNRKTLDSKYDCNQVADQWFSLKQWLAGGAHSCRLKKPVQCPLLFEDFLVHHRV